MYDRNGLELTTAAADTLNSYRLTAVSIKNRKFIAISNQSYQRKGEWTMFNIGMFKDPRDAAYVAQEYERQYGKHITRQKVTDGEWREFANDFVKNIDIPEWVFPAEGLSIDEMTGESGYRRNHVESAREALVEALQLLKRKIPPLSEVPTLIKKVENKYNTGLSYREAAKEVALTRQVIS